MSLSKHIDISKFEYQDNIYLSMIVLQLLIFVLPGIFYCKLKGSGYISNLRMGAFSPRGLMSVLYSFGALVCGSALLNILMYYIFGIEATIDYGSAIPAGSMNLTSITYVAITFAVVPALAEEFIFRGIMLSEYSQNGRITAVIISSLMFAMMHFNLRGFVVYFFGGVVFAFVTYVTDSLFCAILLHFMNNIFGIFLEGYIWSLIMKPNSLVFFLFTVATLFFIFILLALHDAERTYYLRGIAGKDSSREEARVFYGPRALFDGLLSPPLLACVLYFAFSVSI